MSVRDDNFARDQVIRNSTAVEYLGKSIDKLNESLSDLNVDLAKNSEELKECWYLTETNVKKIEDLEEAIFEQIKAFREDLKKFQKYFSEEQENKRKNISSYIQTIVTCIAVLIALLAKMGVL